MATGQMPNVSAPPSRDVTVTRFDVPFGNILWMTIKILLAVMVAPIILSPVIGLGIMIFYAAMSSGG